MHILGSIGEKLQPRGGGRNSRRGESFGRCKMRAKLEKGDNFPGLRGLGDTEWQIQGNKFSCFLLDSYRDGYSIPQFYNSLSLSLSLFFHFLFCAMPLHQGWEKFEKTFREETICVANGRINFLFLGVFVANIPPSCPKTTFLTWSMEAATVTTIPNEKLLLY